MLDINPGTGEIVQYREKDGYDEAGNSIWKAFDKNHEPIIIEDNEKDEGNLSREEIQQEYDVFRLAKEYYADPEELTDTIIEGINDEKFSPFSNVKIYEEDVWKEIMTEKYGDAWKDWLRLLSIHKLS